jgi:predicted Rdx family selenoprotein
MATVTVNEVLIKAQTILQDTTSTRWPSNELVGWLNDSYREIISMRPDANSESGTFTCAVGTRQVLTKSSGGFPNALRLLDIVRNMAATSNKRAVRPIDRRILDDQRRGWHDETDTVNIEHFIFDPKLPREFMVYPPANAQAQLEVVFSSVPTNHDPELNYGITPNNAVTIKIIDSYANAILDYMLYRAYSKDAEYAANANRAMAHYNAMRESIGIKTQTDSVSNPIDDHTMMRQMRRQQDA